MTTKELAEFCKDDTTTKISWISKKRYFVAGKASITENLILLVYVYTFIGDDDKNIRTTFSREDSFSVGGLYHKLTDTLYNVAFNLRYAVEDGDVAEKSPSIGNKINEAIKFLTEALIERTKRTNPVYCGEAITLDESTLSRAVLDSFFNDKEITCEQYFEAEYVKGYVNALFGDEYLESDQVIDEMLTDMQRLVNDMANKMLLNTDTSAILIKRVNEYYSDAFQYKILLADTSNRLYEVKRLKNALKGKKTVLMNVVRNGKSATFRVNANAFTNYNGVYPGYCLNMASPKDNRIFEDAFKVKGCYNWDDIHIEEIDSIMFGGKTIYKKA